MKVKIHTLFEYLLETTTETPEAVLGFSLATPPRLGDFLDALDPDLPLDWNQVSFQGLPTLRQRVIDQAGLELSPETVLITAGAAEANYLVLTQLLAPGDELITERPGWPQAEVLAKAAGATTRVVDRIEAEGWALPLDRLEAAVTPRTKVIFLTNPNNPTGRCLTLPELTRLAEIAETAGAWLIIDEVYAGLEWTGLRAPSIAGLTPRGITTGSVSKALGLQGIRTGWLICQDRGLLMDAVIRRENASEIMNILGEHIAEIALRPDRLGPAMAQARTEGQAGLARLARFLEATPELAWHPPEAGLIGLARLTTGETGESLARRLLAPPYRTFLIPGSAYGLPKHIRLGVGGGASTNLETGLTRLAAALRHQPL